MAQLIVRNLDDELKERLQKRARRHGRSTEEEVREILRTAIGAGGGEPRALGFDGRVLPLDRSAADAAGVIAARQRKAGRPVDVRDVQIAGIAAARKATLATRNVRHFAGLAIPVVDPWDD
jgi:plasmid stability protein